MNTIKTFCIADLNIGRSSSVNQEADLDLSAQGAWRRIADLVIPSSADAVAIAGDVLNGWASSLQEREKFHKCVLRKRHLYVKMAA